MTFTDDAETKVTFKNTTPPIISASVTDRDVFGVQVEHSPEDARLWGAFEETALNENDAWDSQIDLQPSSDTAIMASGKQVKP